MWIDVQQNTDEWMLLRTGRLTSSNFAKIMANEGKSFGEPAIKLAEQIAAEIVTGTKEDNGYSNKFMEDGLLYESVAVEKYEAETFNKVKNGGFNLSNCERFGDSPDGNIGKDGCVEVKTVIRNTQFKRLKKGGYDSVYKWQIVGHLWLGNKQWCDFISFCPTLNEEKQLYIFRIERDDELVERLKNRLDEFWNKEVKPNIELLLN